MLRTFFGVDDDLQAFAEHFMATPRPVSMLGLGDADGAMVATLYKSGRYQVEMCCVSGGVLIPDHTHPGVDTIEVMLAGVLRIRVNGVEPLQGVSDAQFARAMRGRAVRIGRDDWHGAQVRRPGAIFLSIQRWDAEPASVLSAYVGAPLGEEHAEALDHAGRT